jgi:hypothetical protein
MTMILQDGGSFAARHEHPVENAVVLIASAGVSKTLAYRPRRVRRIPRRSQRMGERDELFAAGSTNALSLRS